MKFNKLVPELSVSDMGKSIYFYTKVLGFKTEYSRDKFAFVSLQGSQIMLEEINGNWQTGELKNPFGRGVNFQIEVREIASILKSLEKNKCRLFRKPKDSWYRVGKKLIGCREFLVQDPDGYLLRFSKSLGTKGL